MQLANSYSLGWRSAPAITCLQVALEQQGKSRMNHDPPLACRLEQWPTASDHPAHCHWEAPQATHEQSDGSYRSLI